MTMAIVTKTDAQPTGKEPMIMMRDVEKWYGAFYALKKVNLTVAKGEKIVLCGPSGSGKSTLIRCINRLEASQGGKIVVSGHTVKDDQKAIDAVRQSGLRLTSARRLVLEALEKQPPKVPADPATGPSRVRPPLPPRGTA